jgi:hypothetical protein
MLSKRAEMQSKTWKECDSRDSCYIVYVDNPSASRAIKQLSAFRTGKITEMATYYDKAGKLFGWQFRFPATYHDKITRVTGLN